MIITSIVISIHSNNALHAGAYVSVLAGGGEGRGVGSKLNRLTNQWMIH